MIVAPLPGDRIEGQLRADEFGALFHAHEAKVPLAAQAAQVRRWCKANAVILHLHHEFCGRKRKAQRNLARLGVAARIVDGFLRDAEERELEPLDRGGARHPRR